MGFKKKLKKKLKGIIKSYEDGSKLGDYAQGRLANTKMILDIVKKMDYMPCCKIDSEQLCDKNKNPYEFDSNTYIGRKVVKSDSEQLKELYNISLMNWIELNAVYDENGFYIYKKQLWSLKELSKIYQTDILNL